MLGFPLPTASSTLTISTSTVPPTSMKPMNNCLSKFSKSFALLGVSILALQVALSEPLHAQSATFTSGVQQQVYVVKAGDTLFGISRALGVDARSVSAANNLGSGNVIYIGQRLAIPNPQARSISPVAAPALPSSGNGAFDPYAASGINAPQPLPVQPVAPTRNLVPQQPALAQPTFVQPALRQPTIGNASEAAGRKVMHVVRPGDTLSGIASRYGVNPRSIIDENRLAVPIQIYVDQALFIPGVGAGVGRGGTVSQITTTNIVRPTAQPSLTPVTPAAAIPSLSAGSQDTVVPLPVPLTTTPSIPLETPAASLTPIPPKPKAKPRLVTTVVQAQPTTTPTTLTQNQPAAQAATPITKPTPSSNTSALADPPPDREQRFSWPARGRLLSSFGTKTNGLVNDGVNIAVDVGTEVRAADDGVVAYSGDALKGFGNLLLVKHANNWITAYAHNSTLKVSKGDKIKRGQLIALSGQTGNATQPQLHFEVRQDGRAVDPLNYLST